MSHSSQCTRSQDAHTHTHVTHKQTHTHTHTHTTTRTSHPRRYKPDEIDELLGETPEEIQKRTEAVEVLALMEKASKTINEVFAESKH